MELINAGIQQGLKADLRRRMSPPHRRSVAQIAQEFGIHVFTLYQGRPIGGTVVIVSGSYHAWSRVDDG
jgi:hypothetical protein